MNTLTLSKIFCFYNSEAPKTKFQTICFKADSNLISQVSRKILVPNYTKIKILNFLKFKSYEHNLVAPSHQYETMAFNPFVLMYLNQFFNDKQQSVFSMM